MIKRIARLLIIAVFLALYLGEGARGEVGTMNLPQVSDAQLERLGKKRVPDWLRCPLFYTKDSGRDGLENRKAGDIADMAKQIGANGGTAFRLSVFWGGETYYQSKVAPHAPGLGKIDYLREALDVGQQMGIKTIAYMNPNCLYDDHPLSQECAIRNSGGQIWNADAYGREHNYYACVNHPKYRQFLLDVINEIFTVYKPAGLYVDGLTPHICFCQYCKDKYRRMFNVEMPAKFERYGPFTVLWEMTSLPELVGDPRDPDSQLLTQFLYRSLIDITRDFTEEVKKHNPDAVTLYHSWPKPDTIQYYDGTLDEIYVKEPWIHTLWKDGELGSYGAVFSVPVFLNIYLQHGTEAEARHKMFQALANGVFPNCWNFKGMKPVFQSMRENASYFDFATTSPVKFIALPRSTRRDSIQQKIESEEGFSLPAKRKILLRIQEREPRGKIDLICLRSDGKKPDDEEYKESLQANPENVVYISASDFLPDQSIPESGAGRWNVENDNRTLTGKCVYFAGSGRSDPPSTSLVYGIPSAQQASEDWALWARVLFPDPGSDSFFWSLSFDNGENWMPAEANDRSSVGWETSDNWIWVRGRSVSPTESPRNRFLAPYVGLYSALLRAGLPVVTIHRPDFHKKMGDFKVLCLANEASLTDEQAEAVRQFVAEGGGLIATHETSLYDEKAHKRPDFALADVFGASYENMLPAAVRQLRFTESHDITAGLVSSQELAYDEPHVITRLSSGKAFAHLIGEGLDANGVPGVIANEFGQGRVVYLPGRLDSIQCEKLTPAIERLFANAVRWVSRGKVPVEVDASAVVGVTLFDQPGRRLLHLVNHNADTIEPYDRIDPIENVMVKMRIPPGSRVTRFHSLWNKTDVPFQLKGDMIQFELSKLGEYEVLVAELK
ncbi:hypothetical protein ACFL6S_24280 [Candidatus Poribacteria bacterium]